MHSILIAGGDKRNIYLAGIFNKAGFQVSVCGFQKDVVFDKGIIRVTNIKEASQKSDVIIFGLPVSKDNVTVNAPSGKDCIYLADILNNAKKDAIITGGRVSDEIKKEFGVQIIDYSIRDDFAYLNAVPTAEGAIEACMGETYKTVAGLKCMVTGFGKCGEILAMILKSMNADVHIFARSCTSLAHASALGFACFHIEEINSKAKNYDAIFNTVPFGIFGKECTNGLNPCCVFIDIASAPGGLSQDTCKEKFNYKFLPGIPGKYSPYRAAEIIQKVILSIIRESGKDAYGWLLKNSE